MVDVPKKVALAQGLLGFFLMWFILANIPFSEEAITAFTQSSLSVEITKNHQ